MVELTDAQAAERAARGDAKAFMVLVRRYRAPLIGFIHGRTRLRDEAEDLAQDVFCKAWQYLPTLRRPAAFSSWLYRMAANAAITASRRPRLANLESEPESNPASPKECDFNAEVHEAVGELNEIHRTVVALHHFSGLSTDEIAEALELPPGTVRSRLSRAYEQLRERLAARAAG